MNKMIFVLLSIVFMVLSISVVSASDLNDTNQILTLDSSQINIAESCLDDSNVLEKSNDEEILENNGSDDVLGVGTVPEGSFDELYSLLSTSNVVTLEKDYKYTRADSNSFFNLSNRQITIYGNGHTIDASSENIHNVLFFGSLKSLSINNVVITNVKGIGIFMSHNLQLNGVTVTNSEVGDLITTASDQSYILNSMFINNTVTSILYGAASRISQNVFLNNSVSGCILNCVGYDIEFHNNVLINNHNRIMVADYIDEKGNYYGTDGITINGPDKITTASGEYTFSLSNADLPKFDLLVDITSEYASLDKTVVTLGGGNTATVTVNAKKLENATLTVGSDLVCNPIGTKSIEILYEKVKTPVQFDAVPEQVTVEEGSGNLSLNVVDTNHNGVSGINVKLIVGETVLNSVSGSEGALTFDLSSVPAGEYSAVVVVDDEDYKFNPMNISLTVYKNPKTVVSLYDDGHPDSMVEGERLPLFAQVFINNKPVPNVSLKVTIDKDYVITTDSRGDADLDLSVIPAGNYTVVVVVDDDNYRSSDIISFSLTVNPKNITAEYKDSMASENINVFPVLTAKDLTKKYGTKDQFIASLVDGQGKAYACQVIRFNINGVFHNRVTNSNGQAKLNINLQPGVYIITSSYNGESITNKVTVTA